MRLLSFCAVDGVRLGVQIEDGVVDVHREAAATGLKAPDSNTAEMVFSAPASVTPT